MENKNDKKKYFITTPIYYASGNWHLGHCCTTVYADAIARFKRLDGYDVMFLTGSDEHGQKVEEKAEQLGLTPKEFVDGLDVKFKKLWNLLNVSYDKFIRTTDKEHVDTVQKIYQKLYEQGDIYKSEYEGWYCTPCESFFTQSQLVDGKCPDCGREVKKMKESSYFFKLSKYQDKIEQYYKNNPDFIRLNSTKNEALNSFFKQGLQDICVSRTSFNWGIPLPFDQEHIAYVWIDALSNYISALGYMSEDDSLFKKYWPADLQIMAKEISRFHIITWPGLLMALGLPLPKQVHAHGWLTINGGSKMSKSLGNGLDPFALSERYGVDALRYYILKEGPIMGDTSYDNNKFLTRINSDLCNELGNLLSRTCAMIEQNFDGYVPSITQELEDVDKDLLKCVIEAPSKVRKNIDSLDMNVAIGEIWNVVNRSNKYIDETMPWKLKEDKDRLAVVLHNLYFSLFSVSTLLQAFLPDTSAEMCSKLGCCKEDMILENINEEFSDSLKNYKVCKGNPLFPRINIQEEIKYLEGDSKDASNNQKKK